MADFDGPWKEALELFLPAALELLFPLASAGIDWRRGYEALDKELEQIAPEGDAGKRLVDKLFKVWRHDGREAWVRLHVEVQSQKDDEFRERMFVYHYRIYDRFRRPVVSLAILGDDTKSWRPDGFGYGLWGCEVALRFPTVKLLDFRQAAPALEANLNPFALVVLAHLESLATRRSPVKRCASKVRLVKGLLDRGLGGDQVRLLFKFIDWMLDLPDLLTKQFRQEIHAYAEEKKMPYVTSIERLGREEGLTEGRRLALLDMIAFTLEQKFGASGTAVLPAVQSIADPAVLQEIARALALATSLDEVKPLIPTPGQGNG